MLQRFASAATVGTILIAMAALTFSLVNPPRPEARYLVATVWCVVPVIWGLWAMLMPASWVPRRMPVWGAILGAVAGFVAGTVLDLPARVFDAPASTGLRIGILILAVVLYGLFWMLVREMYTALGRRD